jgi:transcriptional regulator with XRE-family HTH domain
VRWTAETIKQAREDRGWTQKQLAHELSRHTATSHRAVTAWELGESVPSSRRATALAKVLGSPDEDFDAGAIVDGLTDEEVASLLARIPDMAIIADLARRLARSGGTVRSIGNRTWKTADAPPIGADDDPEGEKHA